MATNWLILSSEDGGATWWNFEAVGTDRKRAEDRLAYYRDKGGKLIYKLVDQDEWDKKLPAPDPRDGI